jgi:alanyl aminopeptidase
LAHETAHQWFGDLVTPAWWDDTWLNESFATWMEVGVVGELEPEWDVALTALDRARGIAADDRSAQARRIHEPTATADDVRARFARLTYEKGAAVIAMFERWLGRPRFLSAVTAYLRRHAGGIVTTADFLNALGPPADAAMRTFLDGAGLPMVGVALQCPAGEPPRVRLSQQRYDELATHDQQLWQLPVCLRYAAGSEPVRTCVLVSERVLEIALPQAPRCPDWLIANANGDGYYQVAYSPDLTERLLQHADQLSSAELVATLDDFAAMVRMRKLAIDVGLRASLQFARHSNGFVVAYTARLVRDLARYQLIPDELRPRYAELIRATFGKRARAIGWEPHPDDTADIGALRSSIVPLVAVWGEDAPLRTAATERANRWLTGDRHAVDPLVRAWLLVTAAVDGDRTLLERLRQAARHPALDESVRWNVLWALGAFREPSLAREALASILSGEFPAHASEAILAGAAFDASTQPLAYQFVKRTWPALAARLGTQDLAWIMETTAAFCDEERVDDVTRFIEAHAQDLPGAPRVLSEVVENIHRCASYRTAQRAAARRFLLQAQADTAP